jgi:molybdenum cofactor cytidylyltransferase
MSGSIGIVLLAAGASLRLGGDALKQMLEYRGKSLLRHAAEIACASVCEPIVVVLGANAERLQTELEGLPVRPVLNEQWREGMGTSIRIGVSALTAENAELAALLILLCDQPLLTPAHLNALVAAHRADVSGIKIVASEYGATLGPPCLFDRALFEELVALTGDEGARRIIRRHAAAGDAVRSIPFPEGAADIDTPDDYRRLIAAP